METTERERFEKHWEATVDKVIGKAEFEEAFLTVARLGIGSIPAVERVVTLMEHTQFFPQRIANEVYRIGSAVFESTKRDPEESVAELFEELAQLLAASWAACLVMGALAGTAALGSEMLGAAPASSNGSPTVH